MKSLNFYRCNVCGNILGVVEGSGVVPVCCGEDMELIPANTSEGAGEKHIPVAERVGQLVRVRVGEQDHPMTGAHYIRWIALETDAGAYFRLLDPGRRPEASFLLLNGEKIRAAYAYCNIHGLWVREES